MTKAVPTKTWAYFIFALIFIGTTALSLLFIYKNFGGGVDSEGGSIFRLSQYTFETFVIIGVMLILYFLFDGLRLYFVIRTLDISIPFFYVLKLVFINIFISNITPFSTGGGFIQIYFLNKKGLSVGNASAATSIRTLLSSAFIFIMTPIVLFTEKSLFNIFSKDQSFLYIFIVGGFYAVVIYICYKLIYRTKIIKTILYQFFKFLLGKNLLSQTKNKKWSRAIYKEIDNFAYSIRTFLKGNPKYLALSIGSCLIFLLILFLFAVVLIKGLGYDISSLSILSFQVIITFFMYFAITPGAAGIAEGGFSLIYKNFVKGSDIVSLTFGWRVVTVYIGMIIGIIIFYREMIKGNITGGLNNEK